MSDVGGDPPSDEPFAVSVEPGEAKTVAWTFSQVGAFEYACHVAGHYDAGMFGSISVQG